jgi:hypothetical protein
MARMVSMVSRLVSHLRRAAATSPCGHLRTFKHAFARTFERRLRQGGAAIQLGVGAGGSSGLWKALHKAEPSTHPYRQRKTPLGAFQSPDRVTGKIQSDRRQEPSVRAVFLASLHGAKRTFLAIAKIIFDMLPTAPRRSISKVQYSPQDSPWLGYLYVLA